MVTKVNSILPRYILPTLAMTHARFAQFVIITQLILIVFLEYRLQSGDCHVAFAQPSDWIRPILRFPYKERLFSDKFMPLRHVCKSMGFTVERDPDWFTEQNQGRKQQYDIHLPYDTNGGPVKEIKDQIPGISTLVTYKAFLITRGGKYIPKAFQLPLQKQEFLTYQKLAENREKLWIQKNLNHRGNRVKDIEDMELDTASLVQEYITNAYLIDDRRFSLAVFVALTSTNPVRAYMLNSEVLLRFCAKGYYPLDFTDVQTYIADGVNEFGTLFCEELNSLELMTLDNHYNYKSVLNAHIRSTGENPDVIYSQIYDAIRDVMNRSGALASKIRGNPLTKYYEITRWDFVLDEDLNVYLIEAQHHPGMPARRYATSKHWFNFYSHVIYNMLRVVGLHDVSRFQFGRSSSYIVRDSDVHIRDQICHTSCTSCDTKECYLCPQCLSQKQRNVLKEVFLEHLNRDDMRLVVNFGEDDLLNYFKHKKELDGIPWFEYNALIIMWFREKCAMDMYWCI